MWWKPKPPHPDVQQALTTILLQNQQLLLDSAHMQRQLSTLTRAIEELRMSVKDQLDRLEADLAEDTDLVSTVETLVTNLIQELKDAQGAPDLSARLDAIIATAEANKTRLAALAAQNIQSPAPPVPPPILPSP